MVLSAATVRVTKTWDTGCPSAPRIDPIQVARPGSGAHRLTGVPGPGPVTTTTDDELGAPVAGRSVRADGRPWWRLAPGVRKGRYARVAVSLRAGVGWVPVGTGSGSERSMSRVVRGTGNLSGASATRAGRGARPNHSSTARQQAAAATTPTAAWARARSGRRDRGRCRATWRRWSASGRGSGVGSAAREPESSRSASHSARHGPHLTRCSRTLAASGGGRRPSSRRLRCSDARRQEGSVMVLPAPGGSGRTGSGASFAPDGGGRRPSSANSRESARSLRTCGPEHP